MQMSKRAKRMDRRHDRARKSGALNLVSLMDIFTILVFFLLVNSSEVEVLPNSRDIQLPESIAEEKARETVVVMIGEDEILVQGQAVVRVPDALARAGNVIGELKEALRRQSDRVMKRDATRAVGNREVTIMGDREIPYRLLKKVMATCTDADYGRISLAVLQDSYEPGQLTAAR